ILYILIKSVWVETGQRREFHQTDSLDHVHHLTETCQALVRGLEVGYQVGDGVEATYFHFLYGIELFRDTEDSGFTGTADHRLFDLHHFPVGIGNAILYGKAISTQ